MQAHPFNVHVNVQNLIAFFRVVSQWTKTDDAAGTPHSALTDRPACPNFAFLDKFPEADQ